MSRKSPTYTRGWFIRPFFDDKGRLVALFKNAYRKVYFTRDKRPYVYYFELKFDIQNGIWL